MKLFSLSAHRVSFLMLAPYLLFFFLFQVLPVLSAMGLSFTYFNILEPPRFLGWENYARLFVEDDVFLIALQNTILFVAITGPVSYLLSFFVAWIINELSPRIRYIVTLAFYAPALAGGAVFTIWVFIWGGDAYGLVNNFLLQFGILDEPVVWLKDPKFILPILIVVQLWLSLGTSFLAFIAGLQTVDQSLYDAAAVDGVKNRWQELWYVTLPVMRPYLKFGAVMQITQSFAVSIVSINLIGFPSTNYAGRTIVTHLMDYGFVRFDMGYACAIATILFVIMVSVNKGAQWYLTRVGE